MTRTLLDGPTNIAPGTLTRALHNTATAGSAVITRVIAGNNVSISYTGADAGTGDVTVNWSAPANFTATAVNADGVFLEAKAALPTAVVRNQSWNTASGSGAAADYLFETGTIGSTLVIGVSDNNGSPQGYFTPGTAIADTVIIGGGTAAGSLVLTGSVNSPAGDTVLIRNSNAAASLFSDAGLIQYLPINLAAGAAPAGKAPLYMTSGASLTTPAAGAVEFDGTNLYFTPSTTRETVAFRSFVTASYAPLDSPALTGTPTAPTAAASTSTTQIATTAFVLGQAASVAPVVDGTAAIGVSTLFARQDHVHPSDTTRAALAGATFTGALKAAAGTAALTPLALQSGTLNTTAAAGAIEYDGAAFYATVAASERGVVTAQQFVSLSSAYTLTSQTAAQKLLNATTSGQITLAVGTYEFECWFALSAMSATSGSFGFALGGTATISQVWCANANKAAPATATSPQTTFNTGSNTALATANTTTTGYASIRGTIRVTAAGTIIPQVSLGVAAAAVVAAGSFFNIWPLGSSTVTSVGNWS